MIKTDGITKTFNSGTPSEVIAVKNVSLEISSGEFIVLLGVNGSGKSTLLQLMAGSIMVDRGKILMNDVDVTLLPEHKRSKWISQVFQDPRAGTAAALSIIDNCRIAFLRSQPKKLHTGITREFRDLMREKLSLLGMGLEHKLDMPAGNLSGGQRQALTLLMAVLDDSKLLLMDEPASALDPRSAERLMELASKIIKTYGLTAMLVTHNLKDALNYGDRILMMREGAVVRDISKKEITLDIPLLYEMF